VQKNNHSTSCEQQGEHDYDPSSTAQEIKHLREIYGREPVKTMNYKIALSRD
jgi:hypothetical protein